MYLVAAEPTAMAVVPNITKLQANATRKKILRKGYKYSTIENSYIDECRLYIQCLFQTFI